MCLLVKYLLTSRRHMRSQSLNDGSMSWQISVMLISWQVAASSGKDWYFFTTKPWRLNDTENLYKSTDNTGIYVHFKVMHLFHFSAPSHVCDFYLFPKEENEGVSMRTFIILSLHFLPEESTSTLTVFKRRQNPCRDMITVKTHCKTWQESSII